MPAEVDLSLRLEKEDREEWGHPFPKVEEESFFPVGEVGDP